MICHDLIWTFYVDEEVRLLLCMEDKDVDICSHVSRDSKWGLFATT